MPTLTKEQMEFLKSMDTPTACNVIEMVAPERRGHGYTVKHLFCPFPDLPPIVGFARTVTAKAKDKVSAGDYMAKRMDYLDYVASEPRPTIAVIEDLVRSLLAHQPQAVIRPRGADDSHAMPARDLHGGGSDTAARAMHQHRLARS